MPLRRPSGFNRDNSHYYFSEAGQKRDAETVGFAIDQYAGTEARELALSPKFPVDRFRAHSLAPGLAELQSRRT